MATPESPLPRPNPASAPAARLATHWGEEDARWLDYLDGRLPAAEAQAIEAHLAACPECRDQCRQWQHLDAELARGLARPALSPEFATRLREQIASAPAPVLPAARAQLRAQPEQELQAPWAEYRRRFLCAEIPGLLDRLGYAAAAGVGGYGLFLLLMRGLDASAKAAAGSLDHLLLPLGLAVGALVLVTALGFTARNQLERWLGEL
jgi:anti-sigma factor RsiW